MYLCRPILIFNPSIELMGATSSKGQLGQQNVTHTQQFHPTTRRSASEYWNSVVKQAMESKSDDRFDVIIQQLREDTDAMLCNQPVSDLCFVLPRAKGKSPGSLFAKELVNRYFTNTEDEIGIRIQFNRLLARIADHHRLIECTQFDQETQFRQSRGNNFPEVWEHIREDIHRPLGDNVTQPGPESLYNSVNHTDLIPLCDHLSSGAAIVTNKYSKLVKTDVMQFPVGTLFLSGRLDLFKRNIGQDHIAQVIKALAGNSVIQHVQLGNNFIALIGAQVISDLLKNHQSNIQTWYLGGNELDRACMDVLCHALRKDTVCKSVWLKRNPIKPEGAVFLRRLVEENNTIELMDLQNTGLLDAGIVSLFEGLATNNSLKTLYLDANGIGIPGTIAITKYFHNLCDTARPGITRLWLSMNRLGDAGCKLLLEALKGYIHLETLSLGSNGCSLSIAEDIYSCLVDSPNIHFLDLGMYKATADMHELTNRLGDEGMVAIAKLIAENRHLQCLSISCNGVTNDGLRVFLKNGVKKSESLIHLEYHQYGLKIDEDIKNEIESQLDLNWIRLREKMPDIPENKYQYVRFIKHSPLVKYIDSCYK